MATLVAPPLTVSNRTTANIINLDNVIAISLLEPDSEKIYRIRFATVMDQSKSGSTYYWKFEKKTEALDALNMLVHDPDSAMFKQTVI